MRYLFFIIFFLLFGINSAFAEYEIKDTTIGTNTKSVVVEENTGIIYVFNVLDSTLNSVLNGEITDSVKIEGKNGRGGSLAIDQNTGTVYLTNHRHSVYVIDNMTVTNTITIGSGHPGSVSDQTTDIVIDQNTGTVYVSSKDSRSVSIINDNVITDEISLEQRPRQIALNENTNTVYVLDWEDKSVTIIDLSDDPATETISLGAYPTGITVNQQTGTVYVSSLDNKLSILSDNKITSAISLGDSEPFDIAVNENTGTVYVLDTKNYSVLELTDEKITSEIPLKGFPQDITINRNTGEILVVHDINMFWSGYDISQDEVGTLSIIRDLSISTFPCQENNSCESFMIPDWIKNNAGWWADGDIDDESFIQGIQHLIKEGIMTIPPTIQGEGTHTNEIPDWVKNNAGWWADGDIDDESFIQGIQHLIKEGIITISLS